MSTGVETFFTPHAPAPQGHYAQAAAGGGLLFISGQLPVTPSGTGPSTLGFGDQVRQTLANLLAILEEAGGIPADLIKVTAYIVGIENWAEFNRIYASVLGDAKPARAIAAVPELHLGALVEIEAVAVQARPAGART